MRVVKEAKLECGDLFAGEQDAVRIMNLHKAKGLEAPVVLLACPCGESDHDATEHVDRMGIPLADTSVSRGEEDIKRM